MRFFTEEEKIGLEMRKKKQMKKRKLTSRVDQKANEKSLRLHSQEKQMEKVGSVKACNHLDV